MPYYTRICKFISFNKFSWSRNFPLFSLDSRTFSVEPVWETSSFTVPFPCSLYSVPLHSPSPAVPSFSSLSACLLLALTVQKYVCGQGRGLGQQGVCGGRALALLWRQQWWQERLRSSVCRQGSRRIFSQPGSGKNRVTEVDLSKVSAGYFCITTVAVICFWLARPQGAVWQMGTGFPGRVP